MGDARTMPRVRDGDWVTLRRALNTLSKLSMGPESSPTFGGLSLRGSLDMQDNPILDVGYIDFNLENGLPTAEGRIKWNPDDGTLEVGMPGGNVNLQIGQEMLLRVTNGTASPIANGTPVYVSGASGTNIIVGLADADFATGVGLRTIAVTTEVIAAGTKGYCTTEGLVRDMDTSMFAAEGVPAYLAKGGGLATAPPTSPDITFVIGVVVRKHATEGILLILQTSLPNLSSLSDILLSSLTDNDMLQWDAASSTWQNTADPVFVSIDINNALGQGIEFLNAGGAIDWADTSSIGVSTPDTLELYSNDCVSLRTNFDSVHVCDAVLTTDFGTLTIDDALDVTGDLTVSGVSNLDHTYITNLYETGDAGFLNFIITDIQNDLDNAVLATGLFINMKLHSDGSDGDNTGVVSAFNATLSTRWASSSNATEVSCGRFTANFLATAGVATITDFKTVAIIPPNYVASGSGTVITNNFGIDIADCTGGSTLNYALRTGLGAVSLGDNLILPKTSGKGIMVESAAPTFGYRDLLNKIYVRDIGSGTAPGWATFIGNIKQYQFQANDEAWVEFHVPHDWVPGTDLFIHVHWSHIGTLVTGGSVTWGFDVTYAKGYNQAAFPATVNPTVVGTAHATQYQHEITEVQMSAISPSAVQIDTDDLEVDGIALVRVYLSANNITVSGGAVPDPFMHYCDLHYQSTNMATKDKNTPFYT